MTNTPTADKLASLDVASCRGHHDTLAMTSAAATELLDSLSALMAEQERLPEDWYWADTDCASNGVIDCSCGRKPSASVPEQVRRAVEARRQRLIRTKRADAIAEDAPTP